MFDSVPPKMIFTLQHSTVYACARAGETAQLLKYLSQQDANADLASLALIAAAEANQVETVSMLLEIGAHLEGVGSRPWIRPLWKAAKGGHLEMVQLLISRGADRDAKDNLGLTALDYARRYSRHVVAAFLSESRN